MMKINKTLLLLILLISGSIFAQGGIMKQKKEQLKTMKVAFITKELALTSAEAEKFWPVYNAYDNKQFELRRLKMKAYQQRMDDGSLNTMSEKEASALLTQMENTEEELFSLRQKFVANLRSIISPIKIIKLKKAEEDFNRQLLRQYRNRGKN